MTDRILMIVSVTLFTLLLSLNAENVVMLNPTVTGRVYEGTGSLSAGGSSRFLMDYPEPQRTQILDYLFKPKFGASLNHLKTEIGGDVNSTCGTEPSHQHIRTDENYNRGYEWWLMKEAKRRNTAIKLDVLAWGAPAWIGNGRFYSEDMPDYMLNFLMGAKRNHGLDIDYIGVWNERPYNVEYIKALHKKLIASGLNTKISGADEIRSYYICRDMNRDPELYNAIDVVGTHYPNGQGEQLYNGKTVYEQYGNTYKTIWKEALECGKPIWSQEDGPWAEDWNGAKGLIKVLIRNYVDSKIVKTISWSLITSYHDSIGIPSSGLMKANTPWSGNFVVKPVLWAMAHITQFAEPGWIYLEGGANGYLENGGSYTSLISPDKKDISIIIESVESNKDEKIRFNLLGEYGSKEFYVWKSDSLNQFIKQPQKMKPENGVLSLKIDKGSIYTITTTTGQRKGDEKITIPVKRNFQLPYSDNFESYFTEQLPKYTSDISGVFEIVQDKGNKVLKQVVPAKGIEWAASLNAEPYTVIGDQFMTDYAVKINIKLLNKNEYVYVMGRIPYVRQGQVLPSMGYWLRISTNQEYALCSTLPVIKNGWSKFRDVWKESNLYFTNDTQNSKVITAADIKKWPKERIALFSGLDSLINNAKQPDDLILVLYSNSSYQIYYQHILTSGKVNFPINKWNTVLLKFEGDKISAKVNEKLIFKIKDGVYKSGFAGFGTGWHYGYFDNLHITN